MPTLEISHRDLCCLIGKEMTEAELGEALSLAKCELESFDGDVLKVEAKDTNRPDLWSAEGIARELRAKLGFSKGLPAFTVGKPVLEVSVDASLKDIRPLTVCAVVKGVRINQAVLSQLIQLQEKVHASLGMNRKTVAIGVYDYSRIKPPIKFTSVKPAGIKFIPLDFRKEMTPAEILKTHPKGKEFAHLLEGKKEYPIFIDSAGQVLSMPPIINSDYTGKVTEDTKDLFIECSGFELRFLLPALNVMVCALAERGGKIESVKIKLPTKTLVTPDLSPKTIKVDLDYIRKIAGLQLTDKQIEDNLLKSCYKVFARKGKTLELEYPAYRQDIMHQRDVVEDVIISCGYNEIEPEPIRLLTKGSEVRLEIFTDSCARLLTGLGFQEIMSYILTNKETIFRNMNTRETAIAEIENTVSATWSVFRDRLLPGVMEFLSRNRHVEYPQKVFEAGDSVIVDSKAETGAMDSRTLAAATCHNGACYEEIASALDAFLTNLGLKYELKEKAHPSFIPGRCASVICSGREVGILGEIHPQVLNAWQIENPVAAFEVSVEALMEK
jgi:phenylalanyl-tRNA synthetase beta chain